MANHKSAKKRARQTITRTERNVSVRSKIKTVIRGFREALEAGDKEAAKTRLSAATRAVRKASSKGIFHQRTASRQVARLVRAYNKATA